MAGEKQRNDFAMIFNRIMGPVGKSTHNPSDAFLNKILPTPEVANRQAIVTHQRYGRTPRTTNSDGTSTKAKPEDLTEEDKVKFLKERDKEIKEEENDSGRKSIWEKTLGKLERPLDVLSRPGRTVTNAIGGAAEGVLSGEPVWSLGDDFIHGGWRGLSGQDKEGGGELLQQMRQVADKEGATANLFQFGTGALGLLAGASNTVHDKTDYWEEANPEDLDPASGKELQQRDGKTWVKRQGAPSKWMDRAAGLGTDPTTYVGGGLVTKLKGKGATGKNAFREAGRNAVDDVAGKTSYADDLGDPAAINAVEQARLLDDYENGLLSADDLLLKYAAVAPHSKAVIKGTRTAKDTADNLVKWRPVLTEETINAAKSGRELAHDTVDKVVDRVAYNIHGGPQGRKVVGSPKEIDTTVANHIVEDMKNVRLRSVNPMIARVKKNMAAVMSGKPQNLTRTELTAMKTKDPYFAAWHKAFDRALVGKAAVTKAQLDRAYKLADEAMHAEMMPEFNQMHALAKGHVRDMVERIPTIRMFGNDVMELRTLGKISKSASDKMLASPVGSGVQKLFSYTSNFPGYSSLIAQKSKALGIARYEDFRKNKVVPEAGKLTKQERIALSSQMSKHSVGTGPMSTAADFIRREYDEMYHEEVSAGVRRSKIGRGPASRDGYVKDYTYYHIYNKRKPKHVIDEWLEARNARLKNFGDDVGFTIDDAIAAGFKVERDAFKNLLYRKIKSQRQLTTAYFYRDLVTHYGVKGRLGPGEMKARKLVDIPEDKEGDILKYMNDNLQDGQKLYIDEDIDKIYQNYINLNKNADEIVKIFDAVIRKFKVWNTIYFPGYHIRNMIGDIFMGHMDGVKAADYMTIMKAWPKKSTAKINVGGRQMTMGEFHKVYEETLASGGFFPSDLGAAAPLQGKTIPAGARKLSEGREDFGRIVHFYRAMSDANSALLRDGLSQDKAWEQAINSAIFRVNKYKFDYGALTQNEIRYMRRGIPFYTYMRKAVPTLLESMMLNPKYLTNVQRLSDSLEDDYADTLLPDWMRELGYMKISGAFGMTQALLPTETVTKAFDPGTYPSMINPFVQAPFELNSGKDTFSGRDVNGIGDVLANKWRGVGTIRDASATINAATGVSLPGPFQEDLENSDKTTTEKLANFLGIPIKRIGAQEEEQAIAELNYKIRGKMESLTEDVADLGYSVYFSERDAGMSFRVRDKTTDEVVFEAANLKELTEFVNELRNGGSA
jgi:hypothetical protein